MNFILPSPNPVCLPQWFVALHTWAQCKSLQLLPLWQASGSTFKILKKTLSFNNFNNLLHSQRVYTTLHNLSHPCSGLQEGQAVMHHYLSCLCENIERAMTISHPRSSQLLRETPTDKIAQCLLIIAPHLGTAESYWGGGVKHCFIQTLPLFIHFLRYTEFEICMCVCFFAWDNQPPWLKNMS